MSRRRCDRHPDCKGCDCYTERTKDIIENIYKNHTYKEVMEYLKKPWIYSNLTGLNSGVRGDGSKYKKEYICAIHYYNPNDIYSENEYNVVVKTFKDGKWDRLAVGICAKNEEDMIRKLADYDLINPNKYEIVKLKEV